MSRRLEVRRYKRDGDLAMISVEYDSWDKAVAQMKRWVLDYPDMSVEIIDLEDEK